jgi:hypothetical protein
MADTAVITTKALNVSFAVLAAILAAALYRIFYTRRPYPLAKFPGPRWATSFSAVGAIISVMHEEPDFFMYLVNKYGSKRIFRRYLEEFSIDTP